MLGTSAAFHLAEAGVEDVVLIDRGPVASGTTPMAAGQTGYLNSDRFATDFGLYNVEFFENFEQKTGHAIDFHQNGSLRITLTEEYHQDLERRLEVAAQIGDDARIISSDEARQMVPLLAPAEDCRIMLMPRDGWVEPKQPGPGLANSPNLWVSIFAASRSVIRLTSRPGWPTRGLTSRLSASPSPSSTCGPKPEAFWWADTVTGP